MIPKQQARIFACIALLTASCSETTIENSTRPPQSNEIEVTIATWNVHNLFDTVCDSGACESTDYERQYAPADYKNRVYQIAAGIRQFNSDIVMLQEIEKAESLQDLQAQLPQYPYAVFGETGRMAGLDVALLSKWPIDSTAMHRKDHVFELNGEPKQIARELIEAAIVMPNGEKITIFTTHLVSKVTDPEGTRRENEAKIIHDIIAKAEKAAPNALIAFGGDLNDEPDSPSLTILMADGVLYNSTQGMEHSDITTWNNTAAFDHVMHNAGLKAHHRHSNTHCTGSLGKLNPSDHCAMISHYRFSKKPE